MRRGRGIAIVLNALILTLGLAGPTSALWENWDWSLINSSDSFLEDLEVCSDGRGGMIAAICDSSDPSFPIMLQRIDATGNELWGEGSGVYVPVEIGEDSHGLPVDICLDGEGGAFVAHRRTISGHRYLYVTRFAANGSWDWSMPIGDFQNDLFSIELQVIDVGGAAIVVWSEGGQSSDQLLVAARVEGDGSVAWQANVGTGLQWVTRYWRARPDGQGGVIVGWSDCPSINYERRVQRIDHSGTPLWGANGVLLWTDFGNVVDVLSDGAGGAYVMNDAETNGWGETWIQHVNASGAPTWVPGGVKVLDLGSDNTWTRALCGDGLGGLFVADGNEDLYVQHVDIWGNLLLGPTGLQITSQSGYQDAPDLVADGFGGFIVSYRDYSFSAPDDPTAHAVSTQRYDHFGAQVFAVMGHWFDTPAFGEDYYTLPPRLVTDGKGGALLACLAYGGVSDANLIATGVGFAGDVPARPRLTVMSPDAGAPEEILPVMILGSYLEPAQNFALTMAGLPPITIEIDHAIDSGLLEGHIGLFEAEPGPRDLYVQSPVDADLLPQAFGLGDRIECADDEIFNSHQAVAVTDGSRRKATFDEEGGARMAWIEYNPSSLDYLLYGWDGDENGEGTALWRLSGDPMNDLSYAYHAPGDEHVVFTVGDYFLHYIGFFAAGGWLPDSTHIGDGVENPVVAVDAGGQAHVVFESTIMGESWLFHTTVGPGGFGTVSDIISGAGACEPDLIAFEGGLMLTFVRASWLPGWKEVCTQIYDGVSWSTPESHYTGVQVWSPSLAWDRDARVLLAFLLQNPPGAPLLHTMLIEGGVPRPVRWRPTAPWASFCQIDALDHGEFLLMTEESEGVSEPEEIRLRRGDGNVFYPWRRVNSSDGVAYPFVAADFGVGSIAAWWEEYDESTRPYHRYLCWADPDTPVDEGMPVAAAGLNAYPNPFNPATRLCFALDAPGWVKLDVYDVSGRHVRQLQDGLADAGHHERRWDGRDDAGHALPSGIYFARLQGSERIEPQALKLVLVK